MKNNLSFTVCRQWGKLVLCALILGIIPTLVYAQEDTNRLAWNPVHNIIAVSDRYRNLTFVDASTGEIRNTLTDIGFPLSSPNDTNTAFEIAWSHSGDYIAFANMSNVEVWYRPWDSQLAQQMWVYNTSDFLRNIVWRNDDQQIAVGGVEFIYVLEGATGNLEYEFHSRQTLTFVGWTPDGRIISGGTKSFAALWNMETFEIEKGVTVAARGMDDRPGVTAGAVKPDSFIVALGAADGTIRIWDASLPPESGINTFSNDDDPNIFDLGYPSSVYMGIMDVSWSPDGNLLAFSAQDSSITILNTTTYEKVGEIRVSEYPQSPESVSWSPYGGQLAYSTLPPENSSQNTRAMGLDAKATLGIGLAIPAPTLDRLNTIAEMCVRDAPTPSRAVTGLASQSVASLDALPDFIAQVEALPVDAIPAACRADLLAVAGAIIAQGE